MFSEQLSGGQSTSEEKSAKNDDLLENHNNELWEFDGQPSKHKSAEGKDNFLINNNKQPKR